MSLLVPALQAVVRDELAGLRTIELGVVSKPYTNEGGSGDSNVAVDVRLRGSALELQRVPVAVGRLGFSGAPREGDLALLAFVGGDLNGAVCLGFLYDEQTRAPDASPTELVYTVPDDEASGDRRLELQLAGGNTVTVKDKELKVTMGSTTLTVEADGAITLEAGGDIALKAQGALSLEAQTAVDVKAGSALSLEGASKGTLKAPAVSIAGTTSFSAG